VESPDKEVSNVKFPLAKIEAPLIVFISVPLTTALIAVPLPFRSPEIVVVSVIAGVVVAFATVPASPFADTIERLVTVPQLAPGTPLFSNVFGPVLRKNSPVPEVAKAARFVSAVISALVDCSPKLPI